MSALRYSYVEQVKQAKAIQLDTYAGTLNRF